MNNYLIPNGRLFYDRYIRFMNRQTALTGLHQKTFKRPGHIYKYWYAFATRSEEEIHQILIDKFGTTTSEEARKYRQKSWVMYRDYMLPKEWKDFTKEEVLEVYNKEHSFQNLLYFHHQQGCLYFDGPHMIIEEDAWNQVQSEAPEFFTVAGEKVCAYKLAD